MNVSSQKSRWGADVGRLVAGAWLGAARRRRAARERRSRRRAYTIVEVMMALAVLGIGAAGVVAMQRTTLLGNVRGRNLATANAVAAAWVERVRADALRWELSDTGLNTIGNTVWLNVVGTSFPALDATEGVWFRPAPLPGANISPMADVRGRDSFVVSEGAFCTHLRMRQVLPNMIRVEVRVFWLRHRGGGTLSGNALCAATPSYVAGVGAARDRYHFVYVTTSVLRN